MTCCKCDKEINPIWTTWENKKIIFVCLECKLKNERENKKEIHKFIYGGCVNGND
jgi:hypothetical protein